MTNKTEPRDYHLARRAYEAYFDEQPQVWFENLSHDYQMRWVRAVRAVELNMRKAASDIASREEAETILASVPRKKTPSGRLDFMSLAPAERERARAARKWLDNNRKR